MSFFTKIGSFIGLFLLVVIVVMAHYLVISIFLFQYIANYSTVTFILASVSSFSSVFFLLYVTKIIKTNTDNTYWNDYWKIAELVWLLSAFLALLIGINKYIGDINPKSFNAHYLAADYEKQQSQKQLSELKISAINTIRKYKVNVCNKENIIQLSTKLCNYSNELERALNSDVLINKNISDLFYKESKLYFYYNDRLRYFIYSLQKHPFSDAKMDFDDFWRKQISHYVDKSKLTNIHRLEYSKYMASCLKENDQFCNFLTQFYKDSFYGNMKMKEKKSYLDKIFLVNSFMRELLSNPDPRSGNHGYAGEIDFNTHKIASLDKQMQNTNDNILYDESVHFKIQSLFFRISLLISEHLQFINSLLPLLLGSAFGVRWSKAVAAFRL